MKSYVVHAFLYKVLFLISTSILANAKLQPHLISFFTTAFSILHNNNVLLGKYSKGLDMLSTDNILSWFCRLLYTFSHTIN